MVITCPKCRAQYRIDPTSSPADVARVKCPECQHHFEISLKPQGHASPLPQDPAPQRDRPLVLIVDDARFFREMIKDILQDLPVEILTVADGDEAWQQIVASVPQLVLLDLNIPGKNGKEILLALQSTPALKEVRVIAMSGVERGDDVAAEVKSYGAYDFLNKSFKPRELQKRVQEVLGL